MATREQMVEAAKRFREKGGPENLAKARKLLLAVQELDAQNPQTFGEGLMRAISNVPGSAMQFAEDLIQPLLHPIDTATAMKNLAVGVYQKFTPGVQPNELQVDALADFFKERYGSRDAILRTLREDPVGFLGDAATLLGVGGAMAPGKIGRMASQAASAVDPAALAVRGGTEAIRRLTPEAVPGALYQSAAKFGTTQGEAARQGLTETALREQIPPTAKGLETAYGRISVLGSRVDDLIDDAVARGVKIPKQALFSALKEARQELGGAKLYGTRDLQTVDRLAKQFDEHLKRTGQDFLTPLEVQEFKRDVQNRVNYNRKNLRSSPGREVTEKAFARAARRTLEGVSPELAAENRRLGSLLELAGSPRDPGPLARSAARIENRDILGIGLPLKMMAGEDILPGPGGIMGTIQGIMDMPKVKSRMALNLYRMQHPELPYQYGLGSRAFRAFRDSPVLHGIMFQGGRYGQDIALDELEDEVYAP